MTYKWIGIAGLLFTLTCSTVLAQTDAPTTYGADDVAWKATAEKEYVGEGHGPAYFLNVSADEGHIYVANYLSVLIYAADTGKLEGSIKDASGTVVQYNDVEPAGDGNVWVADTKSYTAYLLDPTGKVLKAIPSHVATNTDESLVPNELEIGPDGNLYVLFSGAHTAMQVFTPTGEFVRTFTLGDHDLSSGLIDFTFGPDSNLYFAGASETIGSANTIRVVDLKGKTLIQKFIQPFLEADAVEIRGLAVDADGNVYIGGTSYDAKDVLTAAIYKFDAKGQLLAQFGKGQQRSNWADKFKPEELGFTVALATLPNGDVVVSDTNSAFNQLFKVNMAG